MATVTRFPTPDGLRFPSAIEAAFWCCWTRRYPRVALHPQVRIKASRGWPRVDFCHLESKTAVECDSMAWHNSPLARRNDALRDLALAEAGWAVVRVGGREIHNGVGRCVERVFAVIEERTR